MIPEKFLQRMQTMLSPAEYEAFVDALARPAVRALRVNTVKTTPEALLPLLPFAGEALPFSSIAFFAGEDKVGAHPAHHAGMFYMQDPSAVSAVSALTDLTGIRALDLCAAPGGKSTALGAAIGESGVLVSNEYVSARCRILQGNVERMGLTNTIITNKDTADLADFYGPVFDLVVADAPCSGEGMLRKYEVAGEEWSEENVALCATRQREILTNAARCVAEGGRLLYATCTFSVEENEQNVAWFLDTHPDFTLIPVANAVAASTADGISVGGHNLTLCRRYYPHKAPGEGQFLALFRRVDGDAAKLPRQDGLQPLTKAETDTITAFLADVLENIPAGRLGRLRDTVYLAPALSVPTSGVFTAGIALGSITKGRVEPHHQFFSALGNTFKRKLCLKDGDTRVAAYLRGEEIDATELASAKNGFAALLYEGAPLGGGKLVSGRLKNHYPKGLRNHNG